MNPPPGKHCGRRPADKPRLPESWARLGTFEPGEDAVTIHEQSLSNPAFPDHFGPAMTPLDSVEQLVEQTASRLRWMRGWAGLWRGALWGASTYLAALTVYKLAPIPREWVGWAGWLAWLAPLGGLVWGLRRRTSPSEAARWLDERQGLQQRLSTALELGRQPTGDAWKELVVADASRAAANTDPRALLPWTLPRGIRWIVLTLVLIVGLGFVPNFRTESQQQAAREAEVIKEVGRELAQLSKKALEQRPAMAEPVRQNMEGVQELGERFGQVKLSREAALQDLAKATEQMKRDATELARNPVLRKMEKAARTPSGDSRNSPTALQKQMEALQKQLGERGTDPEKARELQKDLEQLKDAAKASSDRSSGDGDSSKQKEQLANQARDLARKAESIGLSLPSLNEAIAALNAAQIDQFLKQLDQAERDLDQLARTAEQLAQLQQQAEKLGRDLAEQLKNGQAQAAVESLQRLQQQMKQGGLTEAQKQSLLEEVERAIKPGSQYGEVGKFLKQALENAKQGDSARARESLASAQKELESLLDDMGDMQALMASLQSLRNAQIAIGNCQGWQSGGRKPGTSGKGRPKGGNQGFGDWADDSAWALPEEISDTWDNTGLERKDKDSKGLSDRDSSVPDNLAATKLKGQMQPGGSMPSITLKGLSIRGDSKVAYTEAVQAAQSDAKAALNQEQVPKAYRNAVRDYFDDLKK